MCESQLGPPPLAPVQTVFLAASATLLFIGGSVEAGDSKTPRNAYGQPDLEGVWTNASLTSLERPAQFKTLTIPEAQAKAMEQARARMLSAQSRPTDPNAPPPASGQDPGGYNAFWTDPGSAMGRRSTRPTLDELVQLRLFGRR